MKVIFAGALAWRRKHLTMLKIVDGLINITPLMTSTPPAMLVLTKSHDNLGYYWWQAGMSAAAIELIGWFAMVLRQRIQKHNKTYRAEKAQVPEWPTWAIYGVYLALVLAITVGLELGWRPVWVNGLVALLSLPGTWLAALNYRLEDIQAEYRQKRQETRQGDEAVARKARKKLPSVDELTGTLRRVYDATIGNPEATQRAIGESLGISRQLVGRYQKRLTDMGYELSGGKRA